MKGTTRRGLHQTALPAKGEQHVQKVRCIDSQRRVYFFSFLGVSLVWRVRFGQQGSCAFCRTMGALDIGGGHILQDLLRSQIACPTSPSLDWVCSSLCYLPQDCFLPSLSSGILTAILSRTTQNRFAGSLERDYPRWSPDSTGLGMVPKSSHN